MTKLLDKALEVVRRLPEGSQDEIAQAMLRLASGDGDPEPVAPENLPAILQAKRGQVLT